MKVIDLLNKIANGEEVPKEIYYRCIKYTYDDYMADYKRDIGTNLFTNLFSKERTNCFINDEVEIIEENKTPEKLKILNANEHSKEVCYEDYSKEEISLDIETLQNWVNQIIDYLDYHKSKGK